jgi:NAD(P)-dependent dehydrogenase (short-subunit alcohol dehydrogenase family)
MVAGGFGYAPHPQDGAAWITGASSGIGRETALRLARDGWTVFATARSLDRLEALQAAHPSIIPMVGDVTDRGAMKEIVGALRRTHPIALAVLNAGIYYPMRAQDYDAQKAAQTIDINLTGVSNCLEPLLHTMLEQKKQRGGRGCIALVASVAGYRGLPRGGPYCATKAGLIALAESLAFDLVPQGVRISVINPGFVETPATEVNTFKMPFLMSAEDAAAHIVKGLQGRRFEIAFPTPFVLILKALGMLRPHSYFWVLRKALGWDKATHSKGSNTDSI